MSVIYQPTGMARECSPYALNLYIGCSHRCKYCYAPRTLQCSRDAYFGKPAPRKNILKHLEFDLRRSAYYEQILISFIGDVYGDTTDGGRTTRMALELLSAYHAPVAVLSKGGERMLRDVDVFKTYGKRIMVGASLTFFDEAKSKLWEPNASLPRERLETLKILHESGIKTFAFLEPTIEPKEGLKLIEKTLEDGSVDRYTIGKLNHFEKEEAPQDWRRYLIDCTRLLRPAKKEVYYKYTLRKCAPDVPLTIAERNPDEFIIRA